jgi:fatty acid desaturase
MSPLSFRAPATPNRASRVQTEPCRPELLRPPQVRASAAGLLERRQGFYITVFVAWLLLMAGTWFGFALIGESWFQLLIAAALGILCTQLSFLAHEAGHKQIFASRRANDWSARLLATSVAGISYSWWEQKHGAHHNHPNVISKDPDIAPGPIVFHAEAAAERQGRLALLTRKQGWFFFPAAVPCGPWPADRFSSLHLPAGQGTHRWVERRSC